MAVEKVEAVEKVRAGGAIKAGEAIPTHQVEDILRRGGWHRRHGPSMSISHRLLKPELNLITLHPRAVKTKG